MKHLMILLLLVASCVGGEHRDARDTYNQGVGALAKADFEAAEKLLLEARSQAGVDPELRFRAAYDLGLAYAAHSDKVKIGKEPDLAKALDLAQSAASWFGDAARLRKDDANTQANLAIVRARVQAISDELRKSEGTLEKRLDALIGDQRVLLEDARGAWLSIKQAGGTDPLALQGSLTHLADRERGIVAEAGVLGDLAADEIDAIGKKPDDKRSDEEKVRVVQLKNLDLYLLEGRARIAEARRKLQELAAEDGVAKAEAALVALKRAREQLLDPITVMRGVAQDELALLQDTVRAGGGEASVLDNKPPPETVPVWLEPPVMGERQSGLRDRIEEVRARLAAATETKPDQPQEPPKDPKQAKLLERVRAALPSVIEASAAMDKARQALAERQTKPAIEHERAALVALSLAIEQFADLKQTIELAYGEQKQLVTLLSPEAAKQLPAAERSKQTRDGLARNLARITRLAELISDEVAGLAQQQQQIDAQAGASAGAGAGSAADPKQAEAAKQQAEAAKQQLEQARQQLTHAEELRGQARTALDQLDKALAGTKDPMPPAKEADAKIEELRKLFFSVIEHLQQLIRDQGETRDQTSVANGDDQFSREPKYPNLIGRQDGHGGMAKAITEALAAQADAAGKSPKQQPGAPDPKTLSAAAEEVRQAQSDMSDARTTLVKARDATKSSESLVPAVKSQATAIEHLEAALKLLQPPQQQKQDQNQDKQDQQQGQDKKPEKKPEEQKAGGASQRARDEDARRQKQRRQQESGSDPVEKDW